MSSNKLVAAILMWGTLCAVVGYIMAAMAVVYAKRKGYTGQTLITLREVRAVIGNAVLVWGLCILSIAIVEKFS